MDLSGFDIVKEFEKYKTYLSSCLKTPELSQKEQEELSLVLEGFGIRIHRMEQSDKKERNK